MIRSGTRVQLLAVAVLVTAFSIGAPPAGAEITEGCHAEAVFPDGVLVDPAAGDEFTVPRNGTVEWVGRIDTDSEETEPRSHNGQVVIVLPPLIGDVLGLFLDDGEPDVRRWADTETTATTDKGVTKYNIPGWVPAGAPIRVEGVHNDTAQNCDGWVVLTIDGSPWSSPTTLIAVGGTIAALAGLVLAGKARWRAGDPMPGDPIASAPVRGNPILGFIAGGFLGAFVAPLLWALGVIDLASPVWILLPLVGAIAGTAVGFFPPWNRTPGPPRPGDDDPPSPDDQFFSPDEMAVANRRRTPDLGPAGASRSLAEMEDEAGSS